MRSLSALSVSSALLTLATSVSAQTLLYDNGTIVTHPLGGAGGLDASALDNTATFHPPHNIYGFGAQWASGAGNALADDFTVCGTWNVTQLEFLTYQTNSAAPSITGVYAQIWSGAPNAGGTVVWGNLTTNLLTSPPAGTLVAYRALLGDYPTNTARGVQRVTVPVTPFVLTPGVYWLEQQFTGSGASGPWVAPVSENEVNVTGNGIQRVGATWAAVTMAPAPSPPAGAAIPFRLYGTSAGQVLAAAGTFGTAKAGTNGLPTWDLGTPVRTPILGRDYPLSISNGFAGSAPIVFIGGAIPSGLPFPPFGTIYVSSITTITMPAFSNLNRSVLRLAIPHGANLCGLNLAFQGFWADPAGAGFPLAHTQGLDLTLGN
jgi:hypothetical protein